MVTSKFWRDEAYPVYGIATPNGYGHPIEVDAETLARWNRIEDEYTAMQNEIEAIAKQNPAYFDGKYWHV